MKLSEYHWRIFEFWSSLVFISFACGFADEDDNTYVITGGLETSNTVSRYNKDGWVEDLLDFNTARDSHGCGTYMDDNNNRVS